MHIPSGKGDAAFQSEIERILKTAGHGLADFTRFVFPSANYKHKLFEAECIFAGAEFHKRTEFTGATFAHGADFHGVSFMGTADFAGVTFNRGGTFVSARFQQFASFSGANFVIGADFTWARFRETALFHKSKFSDQAVFHEVTFTRTSDFSEAIFEGDANFYGTTFEQAANFKSAKLAGQANFSRTKFLSVAEFLETSFRKDDQRAPGPIFTLASFSRPEAVIFYKTYLGQALFHNCNISKLSFISIEWRERKRSRKRMIFEEEIDLKDVAADALRLRPNSPNERDYELIEGVYQQLKKNYDEAKDYWTAGDFHYGELEMKRLACKRKSKVVRWLVQHLRLVALYKYASQYGESYTRPLPWLFFVLLLFMGLYPLAGLDLSKGPSQPTPAAVAIHGSAPQMTVAAATQQNSAPEARSELSYGHFSEFVKNYPGRKWVGRCAFFGHSLMTALSVAGFQKELKYEPSYPWGRVLALLELLLTSTLIALFLLAVRRQFRR